MYGVWITYNGQSVLRVGGAAAGCWLLVVGGGLVGGGRAVGGVVHDFHVGADFVGTSVVVSWQALRSC